MVMSGTNNSPTSSLQKTKMASNNSYCYNSNNFIAHVGSLQTHINAVCDVLDGYQAAATTTTTTTTTIPATTADTTPLHVLVAAAAQMRLRQDELPLLLFRTAARRTRFWIPMANTEPVATYVRTFWKEVRAEMRRVGRRRRRRTAFVAASSANK